MLKTKQTRRVPPASGDTLIETIPQLVWIARPDGRHEYVNQRWCDYTGFTLEQIQSDRRAPLQFIHPDDREDRQARWQHALDTGAMYEIECRLRNGNTGSYRWFLARAEPSRDKTGQIVRWVGTTTDIEDQKRIEQQFKEENRENWRVLAEMVPQLVWTTRPDGRVDYCNQRFCDLTQADFEQLRNYGWRQFLHPEDAERVLTFRRHSLATGELYETEYRLKEGQTGEYRWFLARGTPVRDEAGQIIKWFGTNTDIEDQKQIEDALRQSQERVNHLMNSSVIGIFFAEGDTVVEANNTFLRMTGYSQDDLGQRRLTWDSLTLPASKASVFQQAHQELVVQQYTTPFEAELVCKDGSRLDVLMGGVAFHGKTLQGIGFVLDNSARKELDRRKDDFLNMASHELRTPLTAVKLQAQLLRKRLVRQGLHETAAALTRVEDPLNLLERLVKELLDVSKIQAGRLEYHWEPVDLDALLQNVADTMQQMDPTHRIAVRGTVSRRLRGDKGRLEQVFLNLLSNAIKYAPDAPLIEIEASASAETATIAVRDCGIGIPREQCEKIFERFYRVYDPSQRMVPGLGMGLSIVSEIVKHHGGTITVDSVLGKGSTFTVALPLTRDT